MTDTVSFGYEDVAAHEKTARVGGVFSSVAASYDLMNDAMSGGLHRVWKDVFVRRVKPREGEQILDMAGGTGDIAFRLAESGASVTVADINPDLPADEKAAFTKRLLEAENKGIFTPISLKDTVHVPTSNGGTLMGGAAAEQGRPLAEVADLARRVDDQARSMGVALTSCTVPAAGKPTFDLPEGEMEVGIGIHGEPGIGEVP